jgi:glycosyltransferase involved in cell wall biosynthesis
VERVLVLTSNVPRRQHDAPGITAVHIVSWWLIEGLRDQGCEVTLLPILAPSDPTQQDDQLGALRQRGWGVLPALERPQGARAVPTSRMASWANLFRLDPTVEALYPSVVLRAQVAEAVRSTQPSSVLTIWSPEALAATHGLTGVRRVAFHGDVDYVPAQCRLTDSHLFPGVKARSLYEQLMQRLWLWRARRAHRSIMCGLSAVANVTASNVATYARLTRSAYVGNLWPDPGTERSVAAIEAQRRRRADPASVLRIIGHVGYLNRTGSTYGLAFLARLLPQLDEALRGLEYQVDIIGGGEPQPVLRASLDHPRVVWRGYVDDLDRELAASDVFMLLNNSGSYLAAYTRHVMAWADGLCLVAHARSREALPEIEDGQNALLGASPGAVAQQVRRALGDMTLNERIRRGGRETYERHATPRHVARKVADLMRQGHP